MKHFSDQAIVLTRTNFAEADRIITFLTRDHGKVRGLARGVRKQKSKLAGGIELFSISEISFLVGRGEVYTIASSRLVIHFGNIVKDIDRTNTAYEFIKLLNKQTEDQTEEAYFELLKTALESLNSNVELSLIKLWFKAQMLSQSGNTPNFSSEKNGVRLKETQKYYFDNDSMCFVRADSRRKTFSANDIKFLRLLFGHSRPEQLANIDDSNVLVERCNHILSRIEL